MMNDIRHYFHRVFPLSDAAWKAVESILVKKAYGKGDFFARSGRYENKFGIVLEGLAIASVTDTEGTKHVHTIFTPLHFKTAVSFIGAYASMVTGNVNETDIEMVQDGVIFVGDYNDWKQLSAQYTELEIWSRKLAEMFLINKEKRAYEFRTLHADVRYRMLQQDFPEIESLIPQYYIAAYLGISATQLSRIRHKIVEKPTSSLPM